MDDERQFEHTPDPVLGSALRSALQTGDQRAFVARVMARYDAALAEATVPAWEVLARWARPGIAAALVAAVLGGFVLGRSLQNPEAGDSGAMDAAIVPASGPGLAALVTATTPPDASIVFTSLVEPQ
jgi:hypothetical protein